jgi:CubicO group peptidase (beta-lactamase class C family)
MVNWKYIGFLLVIFVCIGGCVNSIIAEERSEQATTAGISLPLNEPDAKISRNIDEYMTALTDAGRFSGTVHVVRGNTVLFSKGYGIANHEFDVPNTPQTVFPIASNTKQLTAAAIMKLQEQGKLNISDPVTKYIPNATNWKDIKIYHLLGHTSGIPSDGGFLMTDPVAFSLPEIIDRVSVLPLSFPPGSDYSYSNNGYITLSYIIERASGMPYEQYMKKALFQPLGMNSTGQDNARDVFVNRSSGYTTVDGKFIHYDLQNIHNTYGAGCMHSTTEDMFLWIRAFNTPGAILTPESTEIMIENNYGINVNVVNNLTMISHGGRNFGFTSQTFSIPEDKMSIILLSNYDRTPSGTLTKDLVNIVYNKPYSLPERIDRKAIPLKAEDISEYLGTYEPAWEKSWTFTVYSAGNRLFYNSVMPRETVELFYEGNDTFFITPESNDALIFTRDTRGNVTGLTMYTLEGNYDDLVKVR